MELERMILQLIEDFTKRLNLPITNIELSKSEDGTYRANLECENPNALIGHHGENLMALQHIMKLMLWSEIDKENAGKGSKTVTSENFGFVLDIDNYRKKQEDNVLQMAEQKAELARKTRKNQSLPPMSPYFRRLIHVHFTQPQFSDLETVSVGQGEFRQLTIRSKELVEE
jgi:spoIIIJ-associated protein